MDAPRPAAPLDTTDPVAAAAGLRPLIEAAAARIEAARELPAELVAALHDAGLFRLLLPRWLGGAELAPERYIRVVDQIARADASTAWCLNQTAVCSITALHLGRAVAEAIF